MVDQRRPDDHPIAKPADLTDVIGRRQPKTDRHGFVGVPAKSPEPSSELQFDEALAHGIEDRLGPIRDLHLLIDVADVVAYCLVADLDPVGDLLVGQPKR